MAAAGTASAPASSEAASASGRGFAYTAYEANAWEATFFKSGELQLPRLSPPFDSHWSLYDLLLLMTVHP